MTTSVSSPTRTVWSHINLDVQAPDIIHCIPQSKGNCIWANALTRQREDLEKVCTAFNPDTFGEFIGVDMQRSNDNSSGRAELVYENGSIHGTFQNDAYAGMLIMANDRMANDLRKGAKKGHIAPCVTRWSVHAMKHAKKSAKFGENALLRKANELGGRRRYVRLGLAEREAKLHDSPLYVNASDDEKQAADQELSRSYAEGQRLNATGAPSTPRRRRSDAASVRKNGRYS